MTLSIIGIDVSYGSCSSLGLLENFLHTGNPCPETAHKNPKNVAQGVINDSGLVGDYQLGLLTNDDHLILDLSPDLRSSVTQLGSISSDPYSVFESIEIAGQWINEDSNRVVLVIVSSEAGAGGILLAHPSRNNTAYALINSFKPDGENQIDFSHNPDLKILNVGYLEVLPGIGEISKSEYDYLMDMVQEVDQEIAIGSISPLIPDISGLADIIYTALILDQKTIPQSNEKLSDNSDGINHQGSFYSPEISRPWLSRGSDYMRAALIVNTLGRHDEHSNLLLTESNHPKTHQTVKPKLKGSEPILIPISGSNEQDLQDGLSGFEGKLKSSDPFDKIINYAYAQYFKGQDHKYLCALIGSTEEDFIKELSHAKPGIQTSFVSGKPWNSPKGSYFTSQPLGDLGLAFVYPGAFNAYPGMGRDLFAYFPILHTLIYKIIKNISQSLGEDLLYPKNNQLGSNKVSTPQSNDFYDHPIELIESGISLSVLHTLILKHIFNIEPDAAFGYSLGEISMLWANDIWLNADESSQRWQNSSLFKTQLFGPMTAVRNYWKDDELENDFWGSYILKAPLNEVEAAIADEPYAFLSIVNTHEEVVIAGKKSACQNVIRKLACHSLPMPFNAVIHNPSMQSCIPEFTEIYTHQTQENINMQFYSADNYNPLDISTNSLAQSMARMTCNPVNFPQLVDRVYRDGVRIFIEVGPQKTCSRWIERILSDQPHAVIPINKKNQSDFSGVLKVISLLLSHRVPVDLTHLRPEVKETSAKHGLIKGNGAKQREQLEAPDLYHRSRSTRQNHLVPITLEKQYIEDLDRLSRDAVKSHQAFLQNQEVILHNYAKIIQIHNNYPDQVSKINWHSDPLYSYDQIKAFTKGDHQVCFGDSYAEFGNRRIPRLPNGELQLIDRVIDIQAQANEVIVGSKLTSELDIPERAWYLKNDENTIPMVCLLESALQPCGFLSAYMGSIRGMGELDLYFRNLDGEGTLLGWPNLLGKTITNKVELLSSNTLQNVIIQEYSFELSQGGKSFYQGKSSFGYFTKPTLSKQTGLDQNQKNTPWYYTNQGAGHWFNPDPPLSIYIDPAEPQLPSIDTVWYSSTGGKFGSGYLYFKNNISPSFWFFEAHFYQDPVMPGSLGIETMAQALINYAKVLGIPESKRWRIKPKQTTTWKYRGQITPEVNQFEIELHIKEITNSDGKWQVIANGHLWNGAVRIYQINDLALETY